MKIKKMIAEFIGTCVLVVFVFAIIGVTSKLENGAVAGIVI